MGESTGPALDSPALTLDGAPHGAISADRRIMGHYLHGIFDHPEALDSLLIWAGMQKSQRLDLAQEREKAFDRLADAFEEQVDMDLLLALLKRPE